LQTKKKNQEFINPTEATRQRTIRLPKEPFPLDIKYKEETIPAIPNIKLTIAIA
jgi:hypothetical protein